MDSFQQQRDDMVKRQIAGRGVGDAAVLDAFRRVPRHEFVPTSDRALAYEDSPLPIGNDQTISQPYIVALMTELLKLRPTDRVLEIGTGSGYQTAILACLVQEVYTIEVIAALQEDAMSRLIKLGFQNIHYRVGDGYFGWPEVAPFNAILVAAASADVPEPLLNQLGEGGRMVLPVGRSSEYQTLKLIQREQGHFNVADCGDVRFVPFQHHNK